MVKELINKFKREFGKDKDLKEIAKGGSIALIIQILGMVLGYILIFVLSRIYKQDTAAVYGQYVLVTVLVKFGSLISNFGINTSMLRFTAGFSKQNLIQNIIRLSKLSVKVILSVSAIVVITLLVFHTFWASLLKIPAKLVLLSTIFIVIQAFNLYFSQSLRGFKIIAKSTFLRNSALPSFNLIFVLLMLPFVSKDSEIYNSLPIAAFYISIVTTTVLGGYWWLSVIKKRKVTSEPYSEEKAIDRKTLLNTSYPLMFAESMIFISAWTNQLMLGGMASSEEVGIFSICIKYTMITGLFLGAVNTISAPKFSEFYVKGDFKNLEKSVHQATKIIFLSSLPIVLFFIFFGNFALGLFGEIFQAGKYALIILSFGKLFSVMCGSVGNILQMTGHQKIVQNVIFISIGINILINLWLIPSYGIIGAAISTAISSVVINGTMMLYVKKYFGFYSFYLFGIEKLFKKNY